MRTVVDVRTVRVMVLRRVVIALIVVLLAAPVLGPPVGAVPLEGPATASAAPSTAVVALEVEGGGGHGCALMSDGTVRCWGSNAFGPLGDGSVGVRPNPAPVPGLADVTSLSAGPDHVCALRSNGRVWCWGLNIDGQVGAPLSETAVMAPFEVPGLAEVVSVDAGYQHTCAVLKGGNLVCWGSNGAGRAGFGAAPSSPTPKQVPGIANVIQVAAGQFNTCALLLDGTVRCWGEGKDGLIGDGSDDDRPAPTAVPGLTDVKQLGIGNSHVCALRVAGTVWCWGSGSLGRLGDGAGMNRSTPVQVFGVAHAASIAVGIAHSCARMSNGGLTCWGNNSGRQLGDGTNLPRSTPVSVPGLDRVRSVGLMGDVSCVVRTGASVRCWGSNSQGLVGDGTFDDRPAPTQVVGMAGSGPWPFASWRGMTDQLFLDLLGRAPGASEGSQFESALGSGALSQGWAAANLRTQPDQVNVVDPTVRLYRALLGRQPDAGGLRFWVNRRRTGSWTLVRMADYFAGSSEFRRRYGTLTNRQFVTRIYTDVLGRAADASGVDYWTRQLDLRRRTRGSVMVGFSESNEYKGKQADNTDLAVAYFAHLGRTPTARESHDWLTRRAAGVAQGDLLDDLLGARAYSQRIGA